MHNQVAIEKTIHADHSESVGRLVIFCPALIIEKETENIKKRVPDGSKVDFDKNKEQIIISPASDELDLDLSSLAVYFIENGE